MALQELTPQPQVTGLTTLGGVLDRAGTDYLQRSRQLADVASGRAYESTESDKTRLENLAAQKEIETFRNREGGIQLLINEGYLSDKDRGNDVAIEAARQRFLTEQGPIFQELFNTPDETGKPLLRREDATNPALVQAAKAKLSVLKAQQAKFTLDQPKNAQSQANDLKRQAGETNAQIAELTRQISALPSEAKQYAANSPEVLQAAEMAAQIETKNPHPKLDDVMMRVPEAMKQLNLQENQKFLMGIRPRHDAMIAQLNGLRYTLDSLTKQADAITARGIYPSATPTAPPGANPLGLLNISAPPTLTNAPAGATSDFISRIGTPTPAPVATSVPAPMSLANLPEGAAPGDLAIQQRGAVAAKTAMQSQIQSQLEQETRKMQEIQDQLSAVRSGQNPSYSGSAMPVGAGVLGSSAPQTLGPDQQAAENTRLLQAAAAQGQKIKALISQLQGATTSAPPAPVSLPSFSDAVSSTPAGAGAFTRTSSLANDSNPDWWKSGQ